jgi:peptidyl-prolyl cis-trans isomerase SurA
MAQDEDPTVDRIVAVVGTAAITNSQLEEELFGRQAEGLLKLPEDPIALARMKRQYVDTLIANELMFLEAANDTTVKVSAQEVSDAVDKVMRASRLRFKNDADFQRELRAAGFQNVEEWRRQLFEQQRRAITIARFRENLQAAGTLAPKNPTERELRKFYDENRAQLPAQPATVSIRQLIVAPKFSPASLEVTKLQADSIIRELRAGADFAVAAKRFSQDPVSAAQGGSLGWQRPDGFVRAFADAIMQLPRGTISEPVVTEFGVHIIQVERLQPTEVLARHILLVPGVDTASVGEARATVERLRAAILDGASFDSLQRIYHDPGEDKELLGFPIPQLFPNYATALEGVPVGGYTPVFELPVEGMGRSKWGFVRVTDRREPGPPVYELLKENLRRALAERMGESAYIEELREKTFVDIRLP